MALPTNITAVTSGHPAIHNATNAAVNDHETRIKTLETTGSSGASSTQLIGAGRPDNTATLTPALQTAVAAAPAGSTFSSTDGASVGAWRWQKLPGGWFVTSGDTGFIDITKFLVNGWTVVTSASVQRTQSSLNLVLVGLNPAAMTNTVAFAGLPQYFQFNGDRSRMTFHSAENPVRMFRTVPASNDQVGFSGVTTSSPTLYGMGSMPLVMSAGGWPTVLPS